MRPSISKPRPTLIDLTRAVNALIDAREREKICVQSKTVLVGEEPNGTRLEIKPQHGGASSSRQVWL